MEFSLVGKVYRLKVSQRLPIDIDEAWQFFSNPKNLATITPDKLNFKIISGAEENIHLGQIIQYKVNPFPIISAIWVTEITYMKEKEYFVDEQKFGPYSFWHHKHYFKSISGGVEMTDIVDYKVPFGLIGRVLTKGLIKKELQNIFTYRDLVLKERFGKY